MMKAFTKLQFEEIIGLLDVRYDTILDDPFSADEFETEDSLVALRAKLENGSTEYTINEAKWIIQELENRKGVAYGNSVEISFGELQGFVGSMNNAIHKLCEAHSIDIVAFLKELDDKIHNSTL